MINFFFPGVETFDFDSNWILKTHSDENMFL